MNLITCGFVKDGVIVALFGGGNEQCNWAQLGEVVGGEAAKRSRDAVVLMRTPLGTQHLASPTASAHAAQAPLLTDKLTLPVSWRNQRSLKVSIYL